MLSATVALLLHGLYMTLRLSSSAGSFPKPLSAEEERDALKKSAEGDIEARNLLVERNLRLVAHVIKKYYTKTTDQDDLISIGTIGLIKAIKTYKPAKNARLATYAARCIENELLMYFRKQKKTMGEISLSESIDTDGDGNSLALMEVICVEDNMLENLGRAELGDRLHALISSELDPREMQIIRLRYGLNQNAPKTQREIAELCNISRSYVSRIEKKALKKLEDALRTEGISH